jgi:SpoVK/Ycf46/Vps4 family AAA+-type ATPase
VRAYPRRDRPIANIDIGKLARRTEGFSGADLSYLCEAASERALMESARSGEVRMIDPQTSQTRPPSCHPSGF